MPVVIMKPQPGARAAALPADERSHARIFRAVQLFTRSGIAGPLLASVFLGILGLFIVGIGITLTTGASLLKSGGRQVLLGLVAASITFGLGWLVGGRLA